MTELSPLAPAVAAWRPSPAELLTDAAGHHLREAQIDAREAGMHLAALAGQGGLTAPQRRRLGQLAATAELIAADAELLLTELHGLA